MAAERRAPTPGQARREWLDIDSTPDGLVIEVVDADEANEVVQIGATFGNTRLALSFPRDDLRGPRAVLVAETFESIVRAVDDRVSSQLHDRDETSDSPDREADGKLTVKEQSTKYSAGIDCSDPLEGHRIDDNGGRL